MKASIILMIRLLQYWMGRTKGAWIALFNEKPKQHVFLFLRTTIKRKRSQVSDELARDIMFRSSDDLIEYARHENIPFGIYHVGIIDRALLK